MSGHLGGTFMRMYWNIKASQASCHSSGNPGTVTFSLPYVNRYMTKNIN